MLTPPTVADLADFTGRAEAGFTAFAAQALDQAALLFTTVTGLAGYPDEPDKAKLAANAILEMADYIYLGQPYAAAKATPYTSETIGSYTYAKTAAVVGKAASGLPTGLLWWDLAVDQLTVADPDHAEHGSISGLERGTVLVDAAGNPVIVGPADLDTGPDIGFYNAELNPRPRLG